MKEDCNLKVLRFEHNAPRDFHQLLWEKGEKISIYFWCLEGAMYVIINGMIVWYLCALFFFKEYLTSICFGLYSTLIFSSGLETNFFISESTFLVGCVHLSAFLCHALAMASATRTSVHLLFKMCYLKEVGASETVTKMPWHHKLYWALLSPRVPYAFLSLVDFWSLHYGHGKLIILQAVLGHLPFVLALLDFGLKSYPLKFLHFYIAIIFSVPYILIAFLFFHFRVPISKESKHLSKYLGWQDTKTTLLTIFIGLIIVEAVYIIFCFLSILKQKLRSKFGEN